MISKFITKLLAGVCIILLINNCYAGLSQPTNSDDDYEYNYAELNNKCQVYDPYESFNRKIFMFNAVLDTFILRPIAKGYGRFTNDYTKQRVGSFLNNTRQPLSTVNYAIQGNYEGTGKSFWRFIINSTFGIAGLFDIASKFDLTAEPQTFGNTLAHYGVGAGPYIILPIFGGSNSRDVMDSLVLNNAFNPLMYPMHKDFKNILMVTRTIHSRDNIMSFTDYVSKNSPDPYIAIRNALLNERESKMVYSDRFICPK